ncbi:MAG: polysaccharide deacetylase family protein, partial [Rhodospirillales bacterium]|nr:polysaccharide deacetylase family protein [Rhodospirillales bacterium]
MDEKDFDPDSIRERLWMNDSCLVALQQDAHVIGLHSYTHPTRMKELSASEQHLEYKKNTEHLGKVLGNRPVCMSHPCNSYNDVTLSALKKLGIQVGFRAYMDTVPSWTQLEYPRVDHAMIMREIKA